MFFWSSAKPTHLSHHLQENCLQNKKVLIVGGTAGIGRALAQQCLKQGAEVTIVGRRTPDETLKSAKFVQKDLSLMKNAVALTNEKDGDIKFKAMDIIVFTNGIITSKERRETAEGLEMDLAVSYLSRLAMFENLSPSGGKGKRIFVMGFPGKFNKATLDELNSEKSYGLFSAHMNTVVGNEALVRHLAETYPEARVFGLNPGLIQTEIRDNALGKGTWISWLVEGIIGFVFQSAERYAQNVLLPLLVSPELDNMNKALFESDGTLLKPNSFLLESDYHTRIIAESKYLIRKALSK